MYLYAIFSNIPIEQGNTENFVGWYANVENSVSNLNVKYLHYILTEYELYTIVSYILIHLPHREFNLIH